VDIDAVLASLTLEEKASLLSGLDRWRTKPVERAGVPSVWLSDGPHGVRRETEPDVSLPATAFPTSSALGATWDPELVEQVAAAIGREAAAQGVHVMLGPGINIKRTPLCGRNFEYLAEDPVLSGVLGAAYVRGMQSTGVGATVKHLAANNQENGRHWMSSEVDERTLREVYLAAFERVVTTAAPRLVMSSYNRVNGVHSSQNPWLLTHVLRDEWGFQGAVVSDWISVHDRVAALRAGLDLEMPGVDGVTDAEVVVAVRAGELDEAIVDRAALRLLALVDAVLPAVQGQVLDDSVLADHRALARRAAADATVLLANDGVLPLDPAAAQRIALIGRFADEPRIQGRGSACVNPRGQSSIREALAAELGDLVTYLPGYPAHDDDPARIDEHLVDAAVGAVRGSDAAIVVVGLPDHVESEGYDRTDLELPAAQQVLLEVLAATGTPLVVVLVSGSAVRLGEWHGAASAVVQAWLAGQEAGPALADVLLGRADPGGRLGETFPLRLEDTPAHLSYPGERGRARYAEGVFVGHRWYDARRMEVRHPFGHGLSYTTFDYTALEVGAMDPESGDVAVALTVTNTGGRPGSDVVQVYVEPAAAPVARPPRELKAFRKVRLEAGESRRVELTLSHRDFAWYDVDSGSWARSAGIARVVVGRSSRDLRLGVDVEVVLPPGAAAPATDAELEPRALAWSAGESERRRVR
jgi:beta-glucosidase